jgi:DNA-binding NarL/FixJ family response regulator
VSISAKEKAARAMDVAGRARVLLVAGDERDRELIRTVLDDAGQPPDMVLLDRLALADQQLDATAVLIVTCDVDRPGEVTALRRLSRAVKEAPIVVVSPRSTATAVRRTLDAGAAALVFEPELFRALIPTLRAVESGQSVVPRNLRAGVERPYLSHRERQVLTLVCEGLTNAEIAGRLILAESTIKSHVSSIFVKFGVHSRREAAAAFTDLTQATADVWTVDEPALPATPDIPFTQLDHEPA